MTPKVTVLMPVYNGEKYLKEAVESILNQTFSDFEFLIIDDGSTDDSWNILKSFKDFRIRLVRNTNNYGIVKTLNKGLNLAKGKYIARMDSDDISLPKRLEIQVSYMEKHTDVGVCGTWVKLFGNIKEQIIRYPVESIKIRINLLFCCCLIHPSIILRSSFFKKYKLFYSSESHWAEDYDLWVRSSYLFKMGNIPKVLLHYRFHENQVAKIHKIVQRKTVNEIQKNQLKNLNIDITKEEIALHEFLSWGEHKVTNEFISELEKWFYKLIEANKKVKYYSDPKFTNFIAGKFVKIHLRSHKYAVFFWYLFNNNTFYGLSKFGWKERLGFRFRGLMELLYNCADILKFNKL